jgi:hypothetical protein
VAFIADSQIERLGAEVKFEVRNLNHFAGTRRVGVEGSRYFCTMWKVRRRRKYTPVAQKFVRV